MSATLAHFPATVSAEALHERLVVDGAVIVDDLVDTATVHRVRSELAPFIEATPLR